MCNRYVPPELAEIEREWSIGARDVPQWPKLITPRAPGPFIRHREGRERELVVGSWGLVPDFSETPTVKYATNNARWERVLDGSTPTFRMPWRRGQRCLIPSTSFDEPNWESEKNVWWRFARADGRPWALAGLWNTWRDPATGELFETYTMLMLNVNAHPLMSRMHKPDRDPETGEILPMERQDKRGAVSIERDAWDTWLRGPTDEVSDLMRVAPVELFDAAPAPVEARTVKPRPAKAPPPAPTTGELF